MTEAEEIKLLEDVAEMKNALLGNKKYDIKGMVHKVNEHEDKLKEYNQLKEKGTGILVALSFVGGLIGAACLAFIKYLTK